MSDRIALVTGASRGIGEGIARRLAETGHIVVGTATSDAGADAITTKLQDTGVNGLGMRLDVTDVDSIGVVLETINKRFGVPEILVNNAGITRDNLVMRMKDEEWQSIIDTNLTAIFRMTKACLRGMIKARFGRIVNITSVVAATGNPGQANYAAAKAGICGFTKSLAREIATRNITVNAVAPGFIDTDMTRALSAAQRNSLLASIPMNRLGESDEVASAVAYFCSDEASYVTGETLHVNGGMYMA